MTQLSSLTREDILERIVKTETLLDQRITMADNRNKEVTLSLTSIEKKLSRLYDKVIWCMFRIGGGILTVCLTLIGYLSYLLWTGPHKAVQLTEIIGPLGTNTIVP